MFWWWPSYDDPARNSSLLPSNEMCFYKPIKSFDSDLIQSCGSWFIDHMEGMLMKTLLLLFSLFSIFLGFVLSFGFLQELSVRLEAWKEIWEDFQSFLDHIFTGFKISVCFPLLGWFHAHYIFWIKFLIFPLSISHLGSF